MTPIGSKRSDFLQFRFCSEYYIYFHRFDYEKEDVVVFRKKNKGSKLSCFAGRGLVSAPYTVVGEFMTDPESSFLWDKFLAVSWLFPANLESRFHIYSGIKVPQSIFSDCKLHRLPWYTHPLSCP